MARAPTGPGGGKAAPCNLVREARTEDKTHCPRSQTVVLPPGLRDCLSGQYLTGAEVLPTASMDWPEVRPPGQRGAQGNRAGSLASPTNHRGTCVGWGGQLFSPLTHQACYWGKGVFLADLGENSEEDQKGFQTFNEKSQRLTGSRRRCRQSQPDSGVKTVPHQHQAPPKPLPSAPNHTGKRP